MFFFFLSWIASSWQTNTQFPHPMQRFRSTIEIASSSAGHIPIVPRTQEVVDAIEKRFFNR